jgi:hypothetical protein
MASAPFMDDLWSSDAKALGDFVRSDQVVCVYFAPHSPILGNPHLRVVYARTQDYYVSTNIHT